jgi:hypothetical protein
MRLPQSKNGRSADLIREPLLHRLNHTNEWISITLTNQAT